MRRWSWLPVVRRGDVGAIRTIRIQDVRVADLGELFVSYC